MAFMACEGEQQSKASMAPAAMKTLHQGLVVVDRRHHALVIEVDQLDEASCGHIVQS